MNKPTLPEPDGYEDEHCNLGPIWGKAKMLSFYAQARADTLAELLIVGEVCLTTGANGGKGFVSFTELNELPVGTQLAIIPKA